MVTVAQRAGIVLNHAAHVVRGVLMPSTVGVRILALSPRSEVVLVRHKLYPGWHLPGGGIDRSESAVEAAVRELFEESGAEAHQETLQLFGVYANQKLFVNDHVIFFCTQDFRRQDAPRLDPEIAECGLFPIHALPQQTTSATRRRIDEFQGRVKPTGRW